MTKLWCKRNTAVECSSFYCWFHAVLLGARTDIYWDVTYPEGPCRLIHSRQVQCCTVAIIHPVSANKTSSKHPLMGMSTLPEFPGSGLDKELPYRINFGIYS